VWASAAQDGRPAFARRPFGGTARYRAAGEGDEGFFDDLDDLPRGRLVWTFVVSVVLPSTVSQAASRSNDFSPKPFTYDPLTTCSSS